MPAPAEPQTGSGAGPLVRFEEQAVMRGIAHGFGFTADMNAMVRQFAGGAAAGDVDGDGDIDVFIVRGNTAPNLLYLNDGRGSFRDGASDAGLSYLGAAAAGGALVNARLSGPVLGDLDGDGDLDLFVGGLEGDGARVLVNDGGGVFTDVTDGSGLDRMGAEHTVSAALGDYDGDGDLDLALAHWGTPRAAGAVGETETLWRNDSTGGSGSVRFTDVTASAGIEVALDLNGVQGPDHDYTFAPSFADIDGDGDQDLLMVSDFNGTRAFVNAGDGTFRGVADQAVFTDENGMGSAVGDIDNDGDPDWFVSSINGNRLYENRSGGFALSPLTADVARGGWGWGSCFADFDGDGRLDIYQTNGWFAGEDPSVSEYVEDASHLWMAQAGGGFADGAEAAGMVDQLQGRGVVCDDFDGDLDVDVLLVTIEAGQAALLWINQVADANMLALDVLDAGGGGAAVGARVQVSVGGVTQTRWVAVNSNFISHNSARLYLGLGAATVADRVDVTWPDGRTRVLTDVAAGQRLVITPPDP
ncbi:MAG: CRTAC1 family protein [Pseudomonadota bacterium]